MAREVLYVAMSRGRHANHTYIVLDQIRPRLPTWPGPSRDGVGGLGRIRAASHTEATATETHHLDEPAPTRSRSVLQDAAAPRVATSGLSVTTYPLTPYRAGHVISS